YAILGRVITAVSGAAYPDFVRDRLLRPLGMAGSGFEAAEFDAVNLARGYRRGPGGWDELVPDGCGAFAPMGGVFSWVAALALRDGDRGDRPGERHVRGSTLAGGQSARCRPAAGPARPARGERAYGEWAYGERGSGKWAGVGRPCGHLGSAVAYDAGRAAGGEQAPVPVEQRAREPAVRGERGT